MNLNLKRLTFPTVLLLNKPIVLANGNWFFPTYARRPQNMCAVLSRVARDKGRTFAVRGQIEANWDLSPLESKAVERKDRSPWMLVRTAMGIGESFSSDAGVTWNPLKVPAIRHTASRFFVGRLKSGNPLLVKHLGIGDDPMSGGKPKQGRELTAFHPKVDGMTWSCGLVLDESVGCSQPDARQAADGTFYFRRDYQRSRDQEFG